MSETKKAMLFGMMLGDGWLTVRKVKNGKYESTAYNAGFSGDIEGLMAIKNDLIEIFGDIGKSTIFCKQSNSEKYGIKGITNSFVCNAKVAKAFIEMGMPVGKRVEVAWVIPDWIMNGSKEVKAAFISGFYCAEGFTPEMQKNDKTIKVMGFTFTKRKSKKDNLDHVVKQFSQILDELGIEFECKFTETRTIDDNIKVNFIIKNNNENIIRFLDLLDFRYSSVKQKKASLIKEYYRAKMMVLKRLEKAYYEAITNRNRTAKSIAQEYGITQSQVEKWRNRQTGIRIPNSFPKFTEFKQQFVPQSCEGL